MTRTARREPASPKGLPVHGGLRVLPLLLAAGAACGQVAGGRSFGITPNASIDITATDNGQLTSQGENDLITRATVGVSAFAARSRVQGVFDYSLSAVGHSSGPDRKELQHRLSTNGRAELIDDRLFIDMSGSVSQQAISAFGAQSTDPALGNANRTQVSTFTVSPTLRGALAGAVGYEARLTGTYSDSGTNSASDANQAAAVLRLSSLSRGSRLSWSADLTRQEVDYSLGRRSRQDRLRVVLGYAFNQDLVVSLTGGRETNNFATLEKASHNDIGVMLNWRPSPRTSLTASYERLFFGSSHSVQFSYRTPRTAWMLLDTRGVSTSTGQSGVTIGTTYDLFFALLAQEQPDPVLRDLLVRQRLREANLNPNDPITLGFVPASTSLQRTQALSAVLFGVRSTLSLRLSRSQSSVLDVTTRANSDLGLSERVEQTALTVDVAHRLTPVSSIALAAGWQRTRGQLDTQRSTLGSLTFAYTTRLGQRADLAAGVRHARFDSPTSPYDENAVWANVRLRF